MQEHYENVHYKGIVPKFVEKEQELPPSQPVDQERSFPISQAVTRPGVGVPEVLEYTEDMMRLTTDLIAENDGNVRPTMPLVMKTTHIVNGHIFESRKHALAYVTETKLPKSDYVCTIVLQVRVPTIRDKDITRRYKIAYKYEDASKYEIVSVSKPNVETEVSFRQLIPNLAYRQPHSEYGDEDSTRSSDPDTYDDMDEMDFSEPIIPIDRENVIDDEDTEMEADQEVIDLEETDDETDDEDDDASDIDEHGNVAGLIDYDDEPSEADRQAIRNFFESPYYRDTY